MAILAAVFVGRAGELPVVLIFMAIQASRELNLVLGVFAGGMWHLSHSTAACFPSRGYFDVA